MPHTTSVSLEDHLIHFIDTQIQAGRYRSVHDVVEAGLQLLQDHEAKVKNLQDALIAGEESGTAQEFDFEMFLSQKRLEYRDL